MGRFSIRFAMALVAGLAVAIAALRLRPLPLRASALFTLVVLLLLVATLGAILRRRPAWAGFALFGWAWLGISFASLALGEWSSTDDRMPVPMPILSIWLLELCPSMLGAGPDGDAAVASIPRPVAGHALVPYSLVQICHLWASLAAAGLGGLAGRALGKLAEGEGSQSTAGTQRP